MAVFGMQLVLTMIMFSVLSKITPHYSFAKWLLCKTGLSYYLHPTDEQLRVAAGISKKNKEKLKNSKNSFKKSGKNGNVTEDDPNTFNVPRNIEINLVKSPVTTYDVMGLRFYMDYQWLLDFAVCSTIIYIISEIYSPKAEINLSMIWCLLVIGFTLKLLFSLSMLYFCGEDSGGEKAMVILSYFIHLLIVLGMLIISEEKLDVSLESAYASFNQSATSFLKAQGLESEGPASKVTFKIILAFFCALIGAFFTFPGLRLGRMHWDSLRLCQERRFLRLLFHISFISPILSILLWVRPIARRYFTEIIFTGYSQPIMNPGMFEISRLLIVILVAILRIAIMPFYLQSYLDIAREKIVELKKEAGKISNKDFQRKIAHVFYYLCVVTLQYATPVIICLFFAFMWKTLGDMSWSDILSKDASSSECGLDAEEEVTHSPLPSLSDIEGVVDASKTLSLGLEQVKKIFTTEFYRGVLGFLTGWCVFTWSLSSVFGVLYQSYFTQG